MKRFIGVIIALLPFVFVLLIPRLITRTNSPSTTICIIAWGALIFGGFIALVNFTLSFCRPYWLILKGVPIEQQRFISGIPVLGTLMLMFINIPLYSFSLPWILATIFLLLDTGGPLWFVICTWNDDSLWGRKNICHRAICKFLKIPVIILWTYLFQRKQYRILTTGNSVYVKFLKPVLEWNNKSQDNYLSDLQKAVAKTISREIRELIGQENPVQNPDYAKYVEKVKKQLIDEFFLNDRAGEITIGTYHMGMLVISVPITENVELPYYYRGVQIKQKQFASASD